MSFVAANPSYKRKLDVPHAALALLFLVAAGLRLYGVNWDAGYLFHPDERYILTVANDLTLPWPPNFGALLDPSSPLNPHSFAYGSFVFYFLKLISLAISGAGQALPFLSPLREASTLDGMRVVGRVISACFDLGTVLMVFLIGRRVFSRGVGILAACFVGFSVLHIQLAHFYAADTIVTFFVCVIIYLCVLYVSQPSRKVVLLIGIMFGLTLATRMSGLLVVLAILVAFLAKRHSDEVGTKNGSGNNAVAIGLLIITGIVTAIVFLIVEPYAWIDFGTFSANIKEQIDMVRGVVDYPYTLQYADRVPYLYFLTNLVECGVGWPLGLSMIAGLLWGVGRALSRRRIEEIIVLSWLVPYFLITGSLHAMFLRYLLPILPFLGLFAAAMLLAAMKWFSTHGQVDVFREGFHLHRPPSKVGRPIGIGLVIVVLLPTMFYAVAYSNLYTIEHTGVSASKWIYQNIPSGAHLAIEEREEALPVALSFSGNVETPKYVVTALNMDDDDNQSKVDYLVERLRESDYIVFYSQRLYGTLPRLESRYPVSTEYYRHLFAGELGFQLVRSFSSYPNLLGIAFVDDTFSDAGVPVPAALANAPLAPIVVDIGMVDQSFTVYDHPKVLIFKKTNSLTEAQMRNLLTGNSTQGPRGGF